MMNKIKFMREVLNGEKRFDIGENWELRIVWLESCSCCWAIVDNEGLIREQRITSVDPEYSIVALTCSVEKWLSVGTNPIVIKKKEIKENVRKCKTYHRRGD